ncbi:MAG TPA: hypothetical protein VMW08_00510 [Acidimicrobiales bacterium]|nr:hypothetical protein [Acidimicrobiales bacterium]
MIDAADLLIAGAGAASTVGAYWWGRARGRALERGVKESSGHHPTHGAEVGEEVADGDEVELEPLTEDEAAEARQAIADGEVGLTLDDVAEQVDASEARPAEEARPDAELPPIGAASPAAEVVTESLGEVVAEAERDEVADEPEMEDVTPIVVTGPLELLEAVEVVELPDEPEVTTEEVVVEVDAAETVAELTRAARLAAALGADVMLPAEEVEVTPTGTPKRILPVKRATKPEAEAVVEAIPDPEPEAPPAPREAPHVEVGSLDPSTAPPFKKWNKP